MHVACPRECGRMCRRWWLQGQWWLTLHVCVSVLFVGHCVPAHMHLICPYSLTHSLTPTHFRGWLAGCLTHHVILYTNVAHTLQVEAVGLYLILVLANSVICGCVCGVACGSLTCKLQVVTASAGGE